MDRKDKNPAAVKSNTEPLLDSTVSSCRLQTFHLIFSLTEPHNFIVTNRAKTTNCHIWIFANSQEHVRSAGTIVQHRWRRGNAVQCATSTTVKTLLMSRFSSLIPLDLLLSAKVFFPRGDVKRKIKPATVELSSLRA